MVVTTEMVGLIIAIGTIVNSILTYRIKVKVEDAKQQAAETAEIARKAELAAIEAAILAKNNALTADKKMDELHVLGNSNLAAANKRLDDALKRIEDLERERIEGKHLTPVPSPSQPGTPAVGNENEIKVAKLEVELQSKPTQASKDGVEGKEDEKEIKVERLDLELVNKPNPEETK